MRIFLDANVVISVLNKEYPLFTYSSRVLSLSQLKGVTLYVSPLSLGICFYFASKKSGESTAKTKLQKLMDHVRISVIDENTSKKAISDPRIHDFEDGMQYFSAVGAKCDFIITENLDDFYFSDIQAIDCRSFITQGIYKS